MEVLFAQAKANAAQQAGAWMAVGLFLCVYIVPILIGVFIHILFLLSVSKCLRQISPENRQMEPGMVWLCLIPLFGIVWAIIMYLRVGDSLREEYRSRRLPEDGDFGKTYGILSLALAVCGVGLVF